MRARADQNRTIADSLYNSLKRKPKRVGCRPVHTFKSFIYLVVGASWQTFFCSFSQFDNFL
jgi:hypothetical protein